MIFLRQKLSQNSSNIITNKPFKEIVLIQTIIFFSTLCIITNRETIMVFNKDAIIGMIDGKCIRYISVEANHGTSRRG